MGGSAKKARRRAAGAALRYDHVPGARTSGRPGKRAGKEEGERGSRLFGTLVFLAVLGAVVLFALADMAWGRTLWGEAAPDWPGGGYGFAVTIGLLLPPAVAGIIAPLTRANWRKEKARSFGWTAAALPGVLLTSLLLVACFAAARPKRRRRGPRCFEYGDSCWVHEQWPYLWLPGVASAVLSLVLGGWLVHRYVKARRARLTPPAPTAPTAPTAPPDFPVAP